jgi:hypothetical protein
MFTATKGKLLQTTTTGKELGLPEVYIPAADMKLSMVPVS